MLTLKAAMMAGSDIRDASREAQRLSDKLDVVIQFDFNGVSCNAFPDGDWALLAKRQQEKQGSKEGAGYKYANSRPSA